MSNVPVRVVRSVRENRTASANQFSSQTQKHAELLNKYKDKSSEISSKLKNLKRNVNHKKNQSKEKLEKITWMKEFKRLLKQEQDIEHWLEDHYENVAPLLVSESIDDEYDCLSSISSEQEIRTLTRMCIANHKLKGQEDSTLQDYIDKFTNIANSTIQEQVVQILFNIERLYKTSVSNFKVINFSNMEDHLSHIRSEIEERVAFDPNIEDRELRNNLINLIYCYDVEVKDKLNQENENYIEQCKQLFGDLWNSEHISLKSFFGFWSDSDHKHYLKILHQSKAESNVLGYKPMTYLELCQKELPHKSQSDFLLHDKWYRQIHSFYTQRVHTIKSSYIEYIRPSVVENACDAIQQAIEIHHLEEMKRKQESQQREEKRRRDEELSYLRKQKLEELEKKLQETREKEREHLEQEEKLAQRALHERLAQKQKLIKYKENERKLKKEIEVNRAAEERERVREKKELEKYNAERVAYRTNQTQLAQERKFELQQQEIEKERETQHQLDKLREIVRQKLKLDLIETDMDRLTQPTESLHHAHQQQVMEVEQKKRNAGSRGATGVHGYTTDELMKDKRFKLNTLLSEVGLLRFNYAKEVVMTATPFKPPRIDTFTTDERQQFR